MIVLRALPIALFLATPTAAFAQPVSDWSEDGASRLRLVAGEPAEEGRLRAGIEIRLQPGWKTYWKNPGSMGLPPRFEWSGSDNVADVDVLWPAPRRIGEKGVDAIGYSGTVMLPLRVTPADPTKPVRLVLSAEYGICENICVPASAAAALDIDLQGEVDAMAALTLRGFEERVPVDAAIGGHGDLAVTSVRPDRDGDALVVEVSASAPPDQVDLFGEGEGSVEAGMARRLDGAPNRFELPLHKHGEGADHAFALVAVAGDRAVRVRVPGDLARPSR